MAQNTANSEIVCNLLIVPPFLPIGSATRVFLPHAIELQDRAFYGCAALQQIVAPHLRHVGPAALMFCKLLEWTFLRKVLTLGHHACAHAGQGGDVWLDSCTTIGAQAFAGANVGAMHAPAAYAVGTAAFKTSTVISLHLGASHQIPPECAAECAALREVACPIASTIGHNAFADCLALEYVECLPQNFVTTRAFLNCRRLTAFDFTACTRIEFEAFAGSGIASVDSMAIQTVGKHAFSKCSQLRSVFLPACSAIRARAFEKSGVQLVQAANIETIGHAAFSRCAALTLDLGQKPGVTIDIGPYAFSNAAISCILCCRTTTIRVAAFLLATIETFSITGVTVVENAAFYGARINSVVSFPMLQTVAYGAFYNAILEQSLELQTVSRIGEVAFAYATAKAVYIGGPAYINTAAFKRAKIDDIIMPYTSQSGPNAFEDLSTLRISSCIQEVVGRSAILWLRSGRRRRAVKVPNFNIAVRIATCIALCLRKRGLHADAVAHVLFLTPVSRFASCNTARYDILPSLSQ